MRDKPPSDQRSAQHGRRTDQKQSVQLRTGRDQSESGTGEALGEIEERGVGTHGETPALRRHAADRFNAESGIHQREAEAGERCACERHLGTDGQPDQRLADGLDGSADQSDLRSADLVGQVAEEYPRQDESAA